MSISKIENVMKSYTTYHISHVGKPEKLPMVVSEKGYALVMANPGAVFCCDVPSYGTHICEEQTGILDYYFMTGTSKEEIISRYHKLIGKC